MGDSNNSQNISISNSKEISFRDITYSVSSTDKSQSGFVDQEMLARLLQDLTNELQKLPKDRSQDVEAISTIASELSEKAKRTNPNPMMVRISANGLMEAAKAIGDVAPKILDISGKVASLVSVLL